MSENFAYADAFRDLTLSRNDIVRSSMPSQSKYFGADRKYQRYWTPTETQMLYLEKNETVTDDIQVPLLVQQ